MRIPIHAASLITMLAIVAHATLARADGDAFAPTFPGYALLKHSTPSLDAIASSEDRGIRVYMAVVGAIEDRSACIAETPGERAAIDAEFAAMVAANQRHAPLVAWRGLEAILDALPPAQRAAVPALSDARGIGGCQGVRMMWPDFDGSLDMSLLAGDESRRQGELLDSGTAADPLRNSIGIGVDSGMSARIGKVIPGGPAARAGMREGDQVLTVDGHRIAGADGLVNAILDARDGQALTLSVRRRGRHAAEGP